MKPEIAAPMNKPAFQISWLGPEAFRPLMICCSCWKLFTGRWLGFEGCKVGPSISDGPPAITLISVDWIIDFKLHPSARFPQAVVVTNRTLSIYHQIWRLQPGSRRDSQVKPDFCFIDRRLNSLNTFGNVWLPDLIFHQCQNSVCACLALPEFPRMDDLTWTWAPRKNKCFNQLIQPRQSSLR